MALSDMAWTAAGQLIKRDASDADSEEPEAGQKEIFASWSLFILIMLLIVALFVSYILQSRRIQAVHETVISIFSGMFVGLILRLSTTTSVLDMVTFNYQFFFNLLLPPIILSSGYELHQGNFFRNIGKILTFAFAGTFISALVLGVIMYLWTALPIGDTTFTFVEAISMGATLSATDPVTILAIFNTYKVDPKLYTVVFGESLLNDAVAIVLFETAQRYKTKETLDLDEKAPADLTILSLFESFGVFLLVFFGSLLIGIAIGVATSLMLKLTYIRRFPKLESCIILLIAYASYFFANAVHMSGIVSLLFCGICMKHYAYLNMSRRTQLTTKFIFQVMSQLSENFIFIYLGLSLFTERTLSFDPYLVLVAVFAICAARWLAVFPLSSAINWVIRYRAEKRGREAQEIPFAHQVMLFWAGLRGAVGVALAAGLTGENSATMKATVLVVVVLTVIIFGGTTARMLEILNIRMGVVEEIDSDDEFDIEPVNGAYSKRSGSAFGHNPKLSGDHIPLASRLNGDSTKHGLYSSGNARGSPPDRPGSAMSRKHSRSSDPATGLLSDDDSDAAADLDLPPAARRPAAVQPLQARNGEAARTSSAPASAAAASGSSSSAAQEGSDSYLSTTAGLRQFLQGSTQDPESWFRRVDENLIKPHLLLDPGEGRGPNNV